MIIEQTEVKKNLIETWGEGGRQRDRLSNDRRRKTGQRLHSYTVICQPACVCARVRACVCVSALPAEQLMDLLLDCSHRLVPAVMAALN